MSTSAAQPSTAAQPWFASVLLCLQCRHQGLHLDTREAVCPACKAAWPVVDGLPSFAGPPPQRHEAGKTTDWKAATEAAVREFYEKNPFPTYDSFDSVGSLLEKAAKGAYGKMLDDQIPSGVRVLECGCGTGQLSTYLSIASRHCLGVDMCMASLRCGKQFRDKHGLDHVDFIQGNLFDLPVAEASFDLVISKGVLHHTPDAKRAFLEVAKRVRPGGYLIIGLYNSFGRIPSWVRKQLYRVVPSLGRRGDFVMRKVIKSDEKRRIWWEDQYNNPHETWHSAGEVLGWFREAGIDYVNAFPPITLSRPDEYRLFQPTRPGNAIERFATQVSWMFTIAREGALFDMIGRRPK
ncbi:MAG TPA: methyltransferase domain-containing protein [Polyangia bacterium]|nr:methyltransferase domain-containing protein [Polyangia bacterium]